MTLMLVVLVSREIKILHEVFRLMMVNVVEDRGLMNTTSTVFSTFNKWIERIIDGIMIDDRFYH